MLKTVDAIVETLGGPAAVAGLAGVGPSAVSNWKARGWIPADHFLTFSEALAKHSKRADPTVFRFRSPVESRA